MHKHKHFVFKKDALILFFQQNRACIINLSHNMQQMTVWIYGSNYPMWRKKSWQPNCLAIVPCYSPLWIKEKLKNIICLHLKFLDRPDNKDLPLISEYGDGLPEVLIQWENKASQTHDLSSLFVASSNVLTTISLLSLTFSTSLRLIPLSVKTFCSHIHLSVSCSPILLQLNMLSLLQSFFLL